MSPHSVALLDFHVVGISLACARALGLIALLPLFSIPQIAGLRLVLALGVALTADFESGAQPLSIVSLVGEFLVGAALGLPAALVVNAAAMWAELLEGVRGQTIVSFFDPFSSEQEGALVSLVRSLVGASLLMLGLGEALVRVYHQSLDVVPLGGMNISELGAAAQSVFRTVVLSMTVVTQAAVPLALVAVVIDGALAFIARLLPQSGLTHEGFLVKSTALFVVAIGWWHSGIEASLMRAALPQLDIFGGQ